MLPSKLQQRDGKTNVDGHSISVPSNVARQSTMVDPSMPSCVEINFFAHQDAPRTRLTNIPNVPIQPVRSQLRRDELRDAIE
jgi:hypothetical protein